jgi:hypothetical protein
MQRFASAKKLDQEERHNFSFSSKTDKTAAREKVSQHLVNIQ